MQWLDRPFIKLKESPPIPNADSRRGAKVDAIFLHYTGGGSLAGSLIWFQNRAADASAHFLVERDGQVVQCVPLDQRAWHAGAAAFEIKGRRDAAWPDKCAVGIELCNWGLLIEDEGKFYTTVGRDIRPYKGPTPVKGTLRFKSGLAIDGWWEPYTAPQIQAVTNLCKALIEELSIPLQRIVGHEDIALPEGRKSDPGPMFPWQSFLNELAKKDGLPGTLPTDMWRLHKTYKSDPKRSG